MIILFLQRVINKCNFIKAKLRRYYYSKTLKSLGENVQLYGQQTIICPWKVAIGSNCSINEYVFIHGAGNVVIEESVTISAYAKIISTGLDLEDWSRNAVSGPFKKHISAPIYINRGAWIGAGVIIMPGVEISGVGVVIAAGSIVTKSIHEDFVVYGGIPARKIKNIPIESKNV